MDGAAHPDEAGAATQQETPAPRKLPPQWHPPAPDAENFDWIQLRSGEWLKGELKYLRDDSLEFESDELDTLEFDLEDVHVIRLSRLEDVVLEGRQVVSGTVVVDRDSCRVRTAEGEQIYPREDIISIVPDAQSRWDYWSGNLTIGMSVQSGNTDQKTSNSIVKLRRRSALSRVSVDYIGNFGSTDGVTNLNNHRADGRWDLFLSQRWFVTPGQLTWFRDPFQNISKQLVPSAGFGYHVFRSVDTDWTISLNAGAQYTEFDSVSAVEDATETVFTLIPGTEADWDITKDVEWVFSYSLQLPIPDPDGRVFHLATTLSLDLLQDLDLDLTFQWDYVANPVARADGSFPETDDYRLSVGIGWDF